MPSNREFPKDLDTVLRKAHNVPDEDFKERLRLQLLGGFAARKGWRSLLGRVRAWAFSYPNGYHLREEIDETMNKSKLLTAFSVSVLVLVLAAFVGLVIVLPSLEPTGEASSPVFDTVAPALDATTGGEIGEPPTDDAPADADGQQHPFGQFPKDIVGGSYLGGPATFPDLVTITADNIAQIQELKAGGSSSAHALAFSPDGRFLAANSLLWELESGAVVVFAGTTSNHTGNYMAFSPDSTVLAAITGDVSRRLYNFRIYILDLRTGATLHEIGKNPSSQFLAVVFTPDGSRLLTGSGNDDIPNGRGFVELWDTGSGEKLLYVGQDGLVKYLAVSPDGRVIASGASMGAVYLWSSELEPLATIEAPGVITGLAFSPDGRWLAYGHQKTIRLWDVAGGVEYMALEGHTGMVEGLAFSPDGSFLASVGQDGSLRLWEVATGRELATLLLEMVEMGEPSAPAATATPDPGDPMASLGDSLNNWVTAVAFSPNGELLVTGFKKTPVTLWGIPLGD